MTLYLVATPIGNLKDISARAVEVLASCDYILCEDTRHSRKLLQHYQIASKLVSFHRFNEASREEQVVKDLQEGLAIGLLSDAGTPALSDPGERLVQRCVKEELAITGIPGPCSLILALILSGFPTQPFQFVGFLPRKKAVLQRFLTQILHYAGTTVCFESPRRLPKLLQEIARENPQRRVAIARELTKIYEEVLRGKAGELSEQLAQRQLKGELVVVIGPPSSEEKEELDPTIWIEQVCLQEKKGLKRSEAIKQVAKHYGLSRKELYRLVHNM